MYMFVCVHVCVCVHACVSLCLLSFLWYVFLGWGSDVK